MMVVDSFLSCIFSISFPNQLYEIDLRVAWMDGFICLVDVDIRNWGFSFSRWVFHLYRFLLDFSSSQNLEDSLVHYHLAQRKMRGAHT